MVFWLVLHSLQLSGAETAAPGISGKKCTYSGQICTTPNNLNISGIGFQKKRRRRAERASKGGHQAPRHHGGAASPLAKPPGCLGRGYHHLAPPSAYISSET